jgi:hypothetical protein
MQLFHVTVCECSFYVIQNKWVSVSISLSSLNSSSKLVKLKVCVWGGVVGLIYNQWVRGIGHNWDLQLASEWRKSWGLNPQPVGCEAMSKQTVPC